MNAFLLGTFLIKKILTSELYYWVLYSLGNLCGLLLLTSENLHLQGHLVHCLLRNKVLRQSEKNKFTICLHILQVYIAKMDASTLFLKGITFIVVSISVLSWIIYIMIILNWMFTNHRIYRKTNDVLS